MYPLSIQKKFLVASWYNLFDNLDEDLDKMH